MISSPRAIDTSRPRFSPAVDQWTIATTGLASKYVIGVCQWWDIEVAGDNDAHSIRCSLGCVFPNKAGGFDTGFLPN